MFTKSIVFATSLALATQAFADQAQWARSAGVGPDIYSSAAISEMRRIAEEGNRDAGNLSLKRLKAQATTVTFSAKNAPSAGRRALAAAAGVSANGVTVHQLHQLLKAQDDREDVVVHRLINDISGIGTTPRASSSAKTQLARGLRVNPDDFSLAELVRMNAAANYDDAHN